MTRVICVLNFKGGTGKTTTVVNLGMALTLRGCRVLAIDLDPQGSLTAWLGVSDEKTLADVLLQKAAWIDCVTRARLRFNVIPSSQRLAEAEHNLLESQIPPEVLARRLSGIDQAGYDYVLLDCAPSVSLLSECAVFTAHKVLVPVSMEYLALLGARKVIIEVLRARRLTEDRSAQLSLIVPSFYDERHVKSRQTVSILNRWFPGLVTHPIRASVRLSEAPSHRLTIFEYDPDGPASQDFARVAKEVMDRDGKLAEEEQP